MNETDNNVPNSVTAPKPIVISQSVAILIDGNNIERSIMSVFKNESSMIKFDTLIPKLLGGRQLNRLVYFREGQNISQKLAERLHNLYWGSVQACHKSADIPLTIKATQLAPKVDTIIILSGDADYVELVTHLKREGVRVEIASIPETTAQILREEADYYHTITEDDCFGLHAKKGSDFDRSRNAPVAPLARNAPPAPTRGVPAPLAREAKPAQRNPQPNRGQSAAPTRSQPAAPAARNPAAAPTRNPPAARNPESRSEEPAGSSKNRRRPRSR